MNFKTKEGGDMDFIINKTSLWGDERPCDEAFEKRVPNWHERTCTEEYYNKKFAEHEGGKWRDKGTNHKCGETIKRREGNKTVWVVKIKTLEELVKFAKKHGKLVFDNTCIEIYDGYRE